VFKDWRAGLFFILSRQGRFPYSWVSEHGFFRAMHNPSLLHVQK
jgi:hypothetical protein